jgi:hypothetical protein
MCRPATGHVARLNDSPCQLEREELKSLKFSSFELPRTGLLYSLHAV